MKKERLFTNRQLLTLLWPLIIEQMLEILVGMADTVMVSSVGEAAISGVSLVDMINQLIITLFGALATGGAVVTSQHLGAKRPEDAAKSAGQLVGLSAILGVGVAAFCLITRTAQLRLFFGTITDEVMQAIEECTPLAPLHNPANIIGIKACQQLMPGVPMVAVFDTAFHQTMPAKAYMYAVPYKYYEQNNIRRWGAHGTSHRFVTARVCEVLGVKPEDVRIITCHIGNGASVSAVKYGKCVDTSMGLTPLEGLVMGTRSGDIDPSAVLSIMKKENLTPDQMSDLLNKQSGVKGISGISSDIREVEAGIREGNERAKLAMEMYDYRIKKYIGAYAAAMGGVDIVVFTAGVGEHQWDVRQGACEDLEFMGIKIDAEKNKANCGEEEIISAPDSKVKVVVVPTDEELLIASDTLDLVK